MVSVLQEPRFLSAEQFLLTTLIVTWGTPGWLLLGGLFLGAGFAMGPAVRWAERSRAARSAPVVIDVGPGTGCRRSRRTL